jgi:hypothetical protein
MKNTNRRRHTHRISLLAELEEDIDCAAALLRRAVLQIMPLHSARQIGAGVE